MDNSTLIIIGIMTGVVIAAYVALYIFRKRQLNKFFNQVFDMVKQVPKQKKNSFLLLLFKESIPTKKNKKKKTPSLDRFNNPKTLEVQLIQMASILKDTSKVKDKTIKRALGLLKDYQAWEKKKNTSNPSTRVKITHK